MPRKKTMDEGAPNWRIGKFNHDNEDQMYMNDEGVTQQSDNSMFSQIKINEGGGGKPMSKHAARRKRKKQGQVITTVTQNPPPGGQIITDADPSLDDLQ